MTALIAPARSGATDEVGTDDAVDGYRSLAVAEVQQVLHELRARRFTDRLDAGGDNAVELSSQRGDMEPRTGGDRALPGGWVTVLAAHAGAGASTVALAISDAAAAIGRSVHLIENARPARSGLVAAASAELGLDESGAWRRGLRSAVIVDRRASEAAPNGWPAPSGDGAGMTVVDLGADGWDCVTADPTNTVVVGRLTVPGARLIEHVLDQLGDRPVVVAAVGPARWPGEVTSSAGPRLRALRLAGRLVSVPLDQRIQVTGLTDRPLPRSVVAAGRALLQLLDPAHPATARPSTTTTTTAPTRGRAFR